MLQRYCPKLRKLAGHRAVGTVEIGSVLAGSILGCAVRTGRWFRPKRPGIASTTTFPTTYLHSQFYLQHNFHNYNINTAKGLAKQLLPRQFLADDKVGRFWLTGGSFDLRGKGCSPQHIFPQRFDSGKGRGFLHTCARWSYLASHARLLVQVLKLKP